jgi:hypothetical protein
MGALLAIYVHISQEKMKAGLEKCVFLSVRLTVCAMHYPKLNKEVQFCNNHCCWFYHLHFRSALKSGENIPMTWAREKNWVIPHTWTDDWKIPMIDFTPNVSTVIATQGLWFFRDSPWYSYAGWPEKTTIQQSRPENSYPPQGEVSSLLFVFTNSWFTLVLLVRCLLIYPFCCG